MYILHTLQVRADVNTTREYDTLLDAAAALYNLADDYEFGYGADLANSEYGFDAIIDDEVYFHAHIEYVKD